MLSTNNENSYPKYIKLAVIPTNSKHYMTKFVKMNANLRIEFLTLMVRRRLVS